jgi:prepilin-type N-terminal cleavage/methylation domain-containing protein
VRRGFTLLELLVAMALLFVVLTAVYESFRIHIHSMERGRAVQKETLSARLALQMLARDLRSTFWEEAQEGEGTEEEEAASEQKVPPFFIVQSIKEGDRPTDRIAFLTLATSLKPVHPGSFLVHEVEYRLLQEKETDRWVLVRREDNTPDDDLLSGGDEWILTEDIRGFDVQCMDAKGQIADDWDSRTRGALPKAVLLRLWPSGAEEAESEVTPFAMHVAIPLGGRSEEGP